VRPVANVSRRQEVSSTSMSWARYSSTSTVDTGLGERQHLHERVRERVHQRTVEHRAAVEGGPADPGRAVEVGVGAEPGAPDPDPGQRAESPAAIAARSRSSARRAERLETHLGHPAGGGQHRAERLVLGEGRAPEASPAAGRPGPGDRGGDGQVGVRRRADDAMSGLVAASSSS
jgi:hypothetical protein